MYRKIGALVLAVAAMAPLASSAMAKGGAGGGASCAQILDFTVTPGVTADQPALRIGYAVNNGCVDERAATVALDSRNNVTGFATRAVNMQPLGVASYSSVSAAGPLLGSFTLTLTVYAPNGKVADTRTQTVSGL
jgi:hypothetical protein